MSVVVATVSCCWNLSAGCNPQEIACLLLGLGVSVAIGTWAVSCTITPEYAVKWPTHSGSDARVLSQRCTPSQWRWPGCADSRCCAFEGVGQTDTQRWSVSFAAAKGVYVQFCFRARVQRNFVVNQKNNNPVVFLRCDLQSVVFLIWLCQTALYWNEDTREVLDIDGKEEESCLVLRHSLCALFRSTLKTLFRKYCSARPLRKNSKGSLSLIHWYCW